MSTGAEGMWPRALRSFIGRHVCVTYADKSTHLGTLVADGNGFRLDGESGPHVLALGPLRTVEEVGITNTGEVGISGHRAPSGSAVTLEQTTLGF